MDKTLWLTFLGHPVNATMEKSTLKYRDGKSTFPIFTLHIFFCHFKTKEIIFFAVLQELRQSCRLCIAFEEMTLIIWLKFV